ncbi:transcriptional regulator [Pseudomonas sp. GCM10022186]|uniref:transcriptional regulator n=1 Tax=Pseudomonas sp. GCM10022186 TaxID=3252650 RepID=UPI0036217A9C
MKENPAQRAAKAAGGQSALARALGCTPQAVQRMCATGHVPAERVLQIEAAVAARVTRYELRPDLYPCESNTSEDWDLNQCTDS